MLDDAGFPDTVIVLSNELDELVIWQILTQIQRQAPDYGVEPDSVINRLVYGVGTRLITSAGDAALSGVYKLVAVYDDGAWVPALKVSDSPGKTLNPGDKHVWRLYEADGKATADLLSLADEDPAAMDEILLRHPTEPSLRRTLQRRDVSEIEPLLVDVLSEGRLVYDLPTVEDMRARRVTDLDRLGFGVKRIVHPHVYHVSLTQRLWELKQELISYAHKEG